MKVITIGRSSQNNVIINDSKVSRHHCQIVQYDDGSYGIVDFGSTNGTFVNGRRVQGEERMNPNDEVRIGYTTLPWRSYFGVVVPPPKKTNVLPIVLGVAGGVVAMVAMIVLLVLRTGSSRSRDILYNGPEPPVCMVTLKENGVSYDVDAAEGQLIVMFKEEVSHKKAVKILKKNQAKILAQMPDVQYYMVEVSAGKESDFFSCLRNLPEVDYVYPKTVDVLCSAIPYIIDNFSYSDHGIRVATMLGDTLNYKKKDIGVDEQFVSGYSQPLLTSLKNLNNEESAVINMSFGPSLIRLGAFWPWQKRPLWNEPLVTKGNQLAYKRRYVNELKGLVKIVEAFDNKDFVVVKAAGNEGMKELEVILEELKNELSPNEYAVLERHFIIVSAKDDNKEGDYPNDVSRYNMMVTKVDISDMTAQDLHWQGTSFSSPRAAGFIISVANSKNMKVTDVLDYARKATKHAPDHILTQELLEKAIEEMNKESTNDGYKINGCLKYRLVKDNSTDMECLELRNTCDEDIRVTGYLLNKIAPHGGDNTLDFETIVHANGTEYIDGFIENKCTITSVEKVKKELENPAPSINSTSQQGIPASLVGTKWHLHHLYTLEFIDSHHAILSLEWHTSKESRTYYCYYDSKKDQIVLPLKKEETYSLGSGVFEYKDGTLLEYTKLYDNGGGTLHICRRM